MAAEDVFPGGSVRIGSKDDVKTIMRRGPIWDRQIACIGNGAHFSKAKFFINPESFSPALHATELALLSAKEYGRDHNIPSITGATGKHESYYMTGISMCVDGLGALYSAGYTFADEVRHLRSYGWFELNFGRNASQKFNAWSLLSMPFRSSAKAKAFALQAVVNATLYDFAEPGCIDVRGADEKPYLIEGQEEIVGQLEFVKTTALLTPTVSIIWQPQLEGFRIGADHN